MIPDEAIEAAAKALWTPSSEGDTWESEYAPYKDHTRAEARRALEAAAPHLMAAAWHEGYDRAELDHSETGFWTTRLRANPYRKPDHA